MTQRERMIHGLLYRSEDSELSEMRTKVQRLLHQYNQLLPTDSDRRYHLICKILGKTGECCSIYPPFFCDYGVNISVGHHFFANVGCVILDVAPVIIGDDVFLGPNVKIITASHPIDPNLRAAGYGLGQEVMIGNRVWIGAGAIINPGITVGSDSVIGSGSVVTHDIPEGVVAVGNPCRVIHSINESGESFGGVESWSQS